MGESKIPTLGYDELVKISEGQYENLSYPLTDWHREQLVNVTSFGIQCLVYMWFTVQPKLTFGNYCNATWDNFYCWPPSPLGQTVTRPCSLILEATHHTTYEKSVAQHIAGLAERICLENSTWLFGHWTNYTNCANNLEEWEKINAQEEEEERKLVEFVRYILFVGSILSFVFLVAALIVFYYFRSLRCDRITIHTHLMIALTLRCILLVVITEPFIFNRTNHYRNYDLACKCVLCANLYVTVTCILWMFLQGVYLHGKLTNNIFGDKGTPFKVYYGFGWGLPLVLISVWGTVMQLNYDVECWKDYSEQSYIWILLGPMIVALVANLLFLINIMRILLTKIQLSNSSGDAAQFRRAVKATMLLFPLLGINNLLFLYNPGGVYKKTFVILNTVFQSTQGIFVSVLYCFLSSDVRDAIRRKYRRFVARRSANSVRRNTRGNRSCKFNDNNTYCTTTGEQRALFITPTHFRSKFKTRGESSRSGQSKSPSPETINNVLPSESPSPPFPNNLNVNDNRLQSPAASINTPATLLACGGVGRDSKDNRYQVSIPMRDLNPLKKN